ncbi:TonB-dependent receptor [Niabella beijingensis]|uniref:TonB-dependent receptor n=1 Tax=Niabella beijingensis TaxID=2872700 RepID=UPI001CBDB42A|nr:TonB-dependent receptor plug domain-containing protein [Niabella beijingensis]MBZ4192593.1 TonB-dependent receptor [Niabella beijingensis]
MKHVLILFPGILMACTVFAQSRRGMVYDADTREPLSGVTIRTTTDTLQSAPDGSFLIATGAHAIDASITGYMTQRFSDGSLNAGLKKNTGLMQEVVVSADRTLQKRTEAPVAIATINKQTIEDTRAQRLDQLLNKVSGVFMVSLGNEQHEMSIRQPMTTKSLFLYMEDGIPIRTTGVYNHNALLEMNLPAARSIEVIKGPSSALYGSEAIGGAVNIITQSAPAFASGQASLQLNDRGYKRADLQAGSTFGKWGVLLSGYYADKHNGPIEYSDFSKKAITLRSDFRPDDKTTWTNTLALVDYYSDMSGSIDSIKFAKRDYTSLQTFTYRKVYALRYKSMLRHEWNSNSNTDLALLYRDNTVGQNPSYSIASTADPARFRGQINENAFKTYALFATHIQKVNWLQSKIVAGASVDYSPQQYDARFISVHKDLNSGKFTSYAAPAVDSFLSNYKTGIINLASYLNYELVPIRSLKLVLALRYDAFQYYFINNLPGASSVSTASTISRFGRFTPKLGLTYNFRYLGLYANYSQGYVPPQLTELYSSVKEAPYLLPQTFFNYEIGGWAALLKQKLYLDWSLYRLKGTNEIISVKQPDNSYSNQNAGATKHTGIEYGITYKPVEDLSIRFSGTNAKHVFVSNTVRGVDYSGKEMSGAPRFTANAEVIYKPFFLKGFRISAEWQHQGRYFMDDLDLYTYKGFDVLNFRAGYRLKAFELWVNALNATNVYYSVFASKNATTNGNAAYSYSLGDPREITIGIAYRFGK